MTNVVGEVSQDMREHVYALLEGHSVWACFMLYRHGDEWWCNLRDKTKKPGDEGRFLRLKAPAGETDQLLAMIGILL